MATSNRRLNFNLCIICQEETKVDIKKPCAARGASKETVLETYQRFLKNHKRLEEVDSPDVFHIIDYTAEELFDKKAGWHPDCKRLFDSERVNRVCEKKRDIVKDTTIQHCKRRSIDYDNCLFCELPGNEEDKFSSIKSLGCSDWINTMINDLQDIELMVKVSGSDLIAKTAKYHKTCLTKFYNRHKSLMRTNNTGKKENEKLIEGRALLEVFCYIRECLEEGTHFFKVAELQKLYQARLAEYGIEKYIHSTRLKELILAEFDSAQAQSDGKHSVIAFTEGMKTLIKDAMKERDQSWRSKILVQAAKIIRDEALHGDRQFFDGSFSEKCQESYIPPALKNFVSLLLNGTNISDKVEDTQSGLAISQFVLYNMRKRTIQEGKKSYHRATQEPPLCTYIGLYLHTQTRSKSMITTFNKFGLCPAYPRVMQIESQLESATCHQYLSDGAVAPCMLVKGRKCWSAIDNIDYNPSSTTSKSSFHGTSISIFQSGSDHVDGVNREKVKIPCKETFTDLPESFSIVPCVEVQATGDKVPWRALTSEPTTTIDESEKLVETQWLVECANLLNVPLPKEKKITWSAFNAERQGQNYSLSANHALLPLFYEKAATMSMIKHGMHVIKSVVNFLNPGQIPMMTCDQPLFAIAKKVQWKFPEMFGEDNFVVWPGGLHIEMAIWSVAGDLLENTGWDVAISEAGIATSGVAKSFLKVSHLMRTRNAHQVTLAALFVLKATAWKESSQDLSLSFAEWTEQLQKKSSTFFFWDLIFELQRKVLLFIRAHREKKFRLYIQTVKEFMPFFFALDHVNYSRWLSVHVRDLCSLPESVFEDFSEGNFVISKTERRFSSIPVDQAHEQENKIVKSTGGFKGLTENPSALKRWMVTGPELARILKEFDDQYHISGDDDDDVHLHHQEGHSAQISFQNQVKNLIKVIESKGNPFLDEFPELIALDTRKVLDSSVSESVRKILEIGRNQYTEYFKNVFEDRIASIDQPIKKNMVPLPRNPRIKVKSSQSQKIKDHKNMSELFGQLYLAQRESDRDELFCHELLSYPPSLSECGKIYYPSSKASLLPCLIEQAETSLAVPDTFDCVVLDGPAVVHFLPIGGMNTFSDFAQKVVIPYIQSYKCSRLDVVFDQYKKDSLKNALREKRGDGTKWKVEPHVKIPKKWTDFLHVSENKKELFNFLAVQVTAYPLSNQVYATYDTKVMSNSATSSMPECTHEEADTRIVVHIMSALQEGNKSILIRTVDTDVVVILLGKYSDILSTYPDTEIWIRLGTGTSLQNIHLRSVYEKLGVDISKGLPFFHSFTGCDTVSSFKGKAKKSAWVTWKAFTTATDVFKSLTQNPFTDLQENSDSFKQLQKFVVQMYSKGLDVESVNEARKILFGQNQNIERLPPTSDALLQHTKRAIYQAGKFKGSKRWCKHT